MQLHLADLLLNRNNEKTSLLTPLQGNWSFHPVMMTLQIALQACTNGRTESESTSPHPRFYSILEFVG
jgi:hypothetical protein